MRILGAKFLGAQNFVPPKEFTLCLGEAHRSQQRPTPRNNLGQDAAIFYTLLSTSTEAAKSVLKPLPQENIASVVLSGWDEAGRLLRTSTKGRGFQLKAGRGLLKPRPQENATGVLLAVEGAMYAFPSVLAT